MKKTVAVLSMLSMCLLASCANKSVPSSTASTANSTAASTAVTTAGGAQTTGNSQTTMTTAVFTNGTPDAFQTYGDFSPFYAKSDNWFFTYVNGETTPVLKRLSMKNMKNEKTIDIKPTGQYKFDQGVVDNFYGITDQWLYLEVQVSDGNVPIKYLIYKISLDGATQTVLLAHNYYNARFDPGSNQLYYITDYPDLHSDSKVAVMNLATKKTTEICGIPSDSGDRPTNCQWQLTADKKLLLDVMFRGVNYFDNYIIIGKNNVFNLIKHDDPQFNTVNVTFFDDRDEAQKITELKSKLPDGTDVVDCAAVGDNTYYLADVSDEEEVNSLFVYNQQTGVITPLLEKTELYSLLALNGHLYGLSCSWADITDDAGAADVIFCELGQNGEILSDLMKTQNNEYDWTYMKAVNNVIVFCHPNVEGYNAPCGVYVPTTGKYYKAE